jgi:NAD(P)-dependent dehydrogenase (short-subunit alcohol dehydrogenase family)
VTAVTKAFSGCAQPFDLIRRIVDHRGAVRCQRPVAHIVNVSNMGGFFPVPRQTLYGASKTAVKLMTEGARMMNCLYRLSPLRATRFMYRQMKSLLPG